MIEALATIGKARLGEGPFEGRKLLDRLVQNANAIGNCPKVFLLVFEETGKGDSIGFAFRDVEIEDYQDDRRTRYLYRFGAPNGADHSPSCKLTSADKTYPNKFLASLRGIRQQSDLSEERRAWVATLLAEAERSAERVVAEIEEKQQGLEKNEGALLVPLIQRGAERLFPLEIESFRDAFVPSVIASFSSPVSGVEASKDPGVCSVCLRGDGKVLGSVSPLNNFSVDKPGFAQGLQQANAWRNFPCCQDCALALEAGLEYVKSNLKFSFYGFDLYLTPYFSGSRPEERLLDKVAKKLNIAFSDEGTPQALGIADTRLAKFQHRSERLLRAAGESEGITAFDFIFYDIEQKATRFLAVVPEVPREDRLKLISETKEKLDALAPFESLRDKEGRRYLFFNFGLLRGQSGPLGKLGQHDPYGKDFLQVVTAVLGDGRLEWDWLVGHLARHLHEAFNAWRKEERKSIEYPARADLMLLYFLTDPKIGVVYRGGERMAIEPKNEMLRRLVEGDHSGPVEAAELAIEGNAGLLNEPVRQAVFLTGALTRLFMYAQKKERKATPFWGKLHGLHLNVENVRYLLIQIRDKYYAYGYETPTKLESLVSVKWLEVAEDDTLSADETSLLFTLGLNLGNYFFSKKEKDKEMDDA